jgi:hypothetical protein
MVRLFTEREAAEHCKDYKPIPLYLQKAILNPPASIRNNPYTDTHRYTEPNYQAPMNPLTMALNAQNLYGFPISNYLEIYNELMEKEIKANRARLDRNLEEEPVDEYADGNYHFGLKTQFLQPLGMDQRVIEKLHANHEELMENDLGIDKDELMKPKSHDNLRGHAAQAQETVSQISNRLKEVIFATDVSMKSSKDVGTQAQILRAPRGRPPKSSTWDNIAGIYVRNEDAAVGVVTNLQPTILDKIVEPLPADTLTYDIDIDGNPV